MTGNNRHVLSWRRRRAGFTLIELLVVTAIFAVTALVATSVFVDVQSSQRTTQLQQRSASDGRSILETVARSVRTGMVYYNLGEITNPTTTLTTVDQNGTTTCYKYQSHAIWVWSTTATLDCTDPTAAWINFTPSVLSIDQLQISITPLSDPFRPVPRSQNDCKFGAVFDNTSGTCLCLGPSDTAHCFASQTCEASGPVFVCKNPNIQPQITIAMTTSTVTPTSSEKIISNLQTTVVSRVYQR